MDIYLLFAYILAYIGLLATCFYMVNLFSYYRKHKMPEPATDKKVSIIIPAYNEEKGIANTIRSALKLDYPRDKLEIVVVDDGSKDSTFKIAKRFESAGKHMIMVFTKENGGKASALNYGIEKCSGEIIVTMDADTFVRPDALKRMVGYFYSDKVMSVSPSMAVYKPRGLWGRIVQIEYFMGVFLRKSFATMNAIHVTPGAFSAYRKKFFEKYGGYQVGNITEDLEVALRIQSKYYIIENAPKAVAYTYSPDSFKDLLYQRRRWYAGLVKNLWAYRELFGFKHGPLGTIVLPVAVSTVLLSVSLTIYVVFRILSEIWGEIASLRSIDFSFNNYFEINSYMFERFFYSLFSRPVFLVSALFICLLAFYLYFSKKQMLYKEDIRINFFLFAFFYSFLFTFWWIVSFFYVLFNKDVAWRAKYEGTKKQLSL